MNVDLTLLRDHVAGQFPLEPSSIHGPSHWKRVERNGLFLAGETGADVLVVRLFALFHDSRRRNEGHDRGHGLRGAELAGELRGVLFELDGRRFKTLVYACTWHTDRRHCDDVTVAACWDADRLDLTRLGIRPNVRYLNSDAAKRVALGKDRLPPESSV